MRPAYFDPLLHIRRRILVRHGYTQLDDWRDVFGPETPLYFAVCSDPCMDAPDYVPAGSTSCHGSNIAYRG